MEKGDELQDLINLFTILSRKKNAEFVFNSSFIEMIWKDSSKRRLSAVFSFTEDILIRKNVRIIIKLTITELIFAFEDDDSDGNIFRKLKNFGIQTITILEDLEYL